MTWPGILGDSTNRSAWQRWARLLLLGALYAQLLAAATQLSATVDEGFHITSGLEYLRTGKVRLFDEHPPLGKALFAWPLLAVPDLAAPESAPAYASGDLISVTQSTILAYRPLDRVIVAPRLAAALLTVVLAATVYRWASVLAGPTAGLLALTLCAFDPNFIAHGSLATTDIGAAACSFWAIWAGVRWLKRPSRSRWWAAALLLGLAQGAKLTAFLIYPVLALGVVAAMAGAARQHSMRHSLRLGLAFAGMVLISGVTLWAIYGFELRPVAGLLSGVPLPAASHIERWLRLQANLSYGRESFLLGQNEMQGWPLYFPVAALVKTPLPLLLLGVWALTRTLHRAVASRRSLRVLRRFADPMILFPLFYALASLTSPLNIGYRHLLPVLPFIYVGLALKLAPTAPSFPPHASPFRGRASHRIRRASLLLLVIWLALGALVSAPHYLAYFNEIAGGSDNGWRFLADSNTDWGQTYKALAAYQDESGLGPVRLSAFTFYDPAAYGVEYIPITPMAAADPVLNRRLNPEAGTYAISATTLDGVPLAYPPTFDWFRHRVPVAKIGGAMFLYEVAPLAGAWIAQCTTPVSPLPDAAIDEGFGVPVLRRVSFNCESSWVLPAGGSTPGWYALAIPEQTALRWPSPDDAQRFDLLPAWVSSLPAAGLNLSYLQSRNGELPAFAVWECAECRWAQSEASTELEGLLSFTGIAAPEHAKPGASVEVVTYWTVIEPPPRPLSIMLHVRGVDGTPVAVGDGLGFPFDQWQPGDTFAQRHLLSLPSNLPAGTYQVYTGAYWLDDLLVLAGSIQPVPLAITP